MNITLKKNLKTTIAGLVAGISLLTAGVVSAETYTVKSGDTLSEIAETHNTTVEKLAEQNKISNLDFIHVGQVIELGDVTVNAVESSVEQAQSATSSTSTATVTTSTYSSNLSAEDAAAKEWIAMKESSGSYDARNGIYIGRYQLTNTYLNGDYSPENQERVADAYVAERYGSWSAAKAFWLANGWY
ncbi:LysM peptidoglycan-binding domain-containing protein [Streptococcus suis]|uniref:aggregation-promoting factor n=1 Tax=Streptococcus suis TaxID=1307 RepID=UPI0015543D09|nr:LysM domain-containing protein [Streptococcus suis]MDG4505726.1 LysM peptidoglycan-binding domain-containing protein [Streptococcus suis]NQJ30246.1 LysM peptidoglycan-binding domain-containing protein [Streptococcus suis]NQM16668.1 LysM peptidoglycan-binding domain-containing protein [Streptococcus suis]HEM2777756.1 LysM peptidoglycan-binding domain-containing protein [Streptococcus suis]HEM2828420.1 LysM peptidoglycan-binding domain-containing protein [Streptococcus suis]